MRLCIVFIFTLFMYFFCVDYSYTSPYPSNPIEQTLSQKNGILKCHVMKIFNLLQIFVSGLCLITSLCLMLLELCNHVTYVRFDTNLALHRKKRRNPLKKIKFYLSLVTMGLIASVFHVDFFILVSLYYCPNFLLIMIRIVFFNYRLIACSCFHVSCMFIFLDACSPFASILCVFVLQIWCNA